MSRCYLAIINYGGSLLFNCNFEVKVYNCIGKRRIDGDAIPCLQRSLFVLGTRRRRDLCLDPTRFLSRMCKNCHDYE